MTDKEKVERALKIYHKTFGGAAMKPALELTEVDGDVVTLRNNYRELAKVDLKKNEVNINEDYDTFLSHEGTDE